MITDTPASPRSPAPTCIKVEELLAQVSSQLDRANALDLQTFKTQLTSASTQMQQSISDYATAYATPVTGLLARWCTANKTVEKLHQTLVCTFKEGAWKTSLLRCACPVIGAIASLTKEINTRTNCSKGELELVAAKAQAARDAAAGARDQWINAIANITAILDGNDALIKTIQGQLNSVDQSGAMYTFWFQLLPSHLKIMPSNAAAGTCSVGKGESVAEICGGSSDDRRVPPYLIDPSKYGETLDCAWQDLFNAQQTYADAQAEYLKTPDDLNARQTSLTANTASQDGDILFKLSAQNTPGAARAPTTTAPTLGA